MPPETKPVPNPNNETMTKERSLVNIFKDRKLFNPDGTEVVMSKTARTALHIIMKEQPDVQSDVTFRNFKKDEKKPPRRDHKLKIIDFENSEWEVLLSNKRPDMSSKNGRLINIETLTKRMGLRSEDITEDFASTFAAVRPIGHYFYYRGKTGSWGKEKLNDISKEFGKEEEKLKEKPKEERDLLLTKFIVNHPEEVKADEYAVKWMGKHMYLFNPEVNPYLGQWSVEPEQNPLQAGLVYQNPS